MLGKVRWREMTRVYSSSILILLLIWGQVSFGDDYMMTCSRPVKSPRRQSRLHENFYCDKFEGNGRTSSWCSVPGNHYPWHAVRRFVFENQGLMRRMYGEVRQLSLLRMELDENEKNPDILSNSIVTDQGREFITDDELLSEFSEKKFFPTLTQHLTQKPPILLEENLENLENHKIDAEDAEDNSKVNSGSKERINSKEMEIDNVDQNQDKFRILDEEIFDDEAEDQVQPENEKILQIPEEDSSGKEKDKSSSEISPIDISVESATSSSTSSTTTVKLETTKTLENPSASPQQQQVVKNRSSTEEIDEEIGGQSTTNSPAGSGLLSGISIEDDVTLTTLFSSGENLISSTTSMSTLTTSFNSSEIFENKSEEKDKENDKVTPAESMERNSGGGQQQLGLTNDQIPDGPQQIGSNIVQGSSSSPSIRVVNACPVKEEVVAPYWANNTRGEILALLNLYPFEQYIHWEKCTYENKQMYCRDGCRCEQQYRLHRLLAFDPNNECRGIFSDWFRFPSCCICKCYLYENVANDLYNDKLNFNNNRSPRSKKHFYYN